MIGKTLKRVSFERGIQQRDVAEKLGYSKQRVNNYYNDVAHPPEDFFNKFRLEFNVDLKKLSEQSSDAKEVTAFRPIPVYDLELKPNSDPDFFKFNDLIAYYIDVPMFNDCFAAVKVGGVSMLPQFGPSDLIAIKKLNNFDTVPYGEPFVILTDEHRFLRYLCVNKKDANTLILRSGNPEVNNDVTIRKSEIKYLFQVMGKISRL